MKLPDKELIDKLAGLSHLHFEDVEKEQLLRDLKKMTAFVQKLDELDTTGVEPLIYPNESAGSLRADVPGKPLSKDEALQNAPLYENDMFRVPLTVKKK